jgi:hypothetical protein
VKGYWKDGQFVAGQTVKTAGTGGVGTLELEVAAAVARARESRTALEELGNLLNQHPMLKVDVPDQTWNQERVCWEGPLHLLTPLAALYAQQTQQQGHRPWA